MIPLACAKASETVKSLWPANLQTEYLLCIVNYYDNPNLTIDAAL